MTQRTATYYPQRVNTRVPNMVMHTDVDDDGQTRCELGAPVAPDTDGILAAQSIASAGSTTTLAATYTYDKMGTYGRRLTVVASGAATSTVTVKGRDYLNQPMTEVLTLNGNTPVNGVKAFKYIDYIEWGATSGTTIDVGWGNGLGLPFRMVSMERELVSGAVTSNAGALTAGASATSAQTSTSNDPRGLYVPHSSNVPDGSRTYSVLGIADKSQLHGQAHYYA